MISATDMYNKKHGVEISPFVRSPSMVLLRASHWLKAEQPGFMVWALESGVSNGH